MYYGPSDSELYRHAAVQVDKILKGTKPADLPVEQPKKFELVIHLKAAKPIGITIPPNVLARSGYGNPMNRQSKIGNRKSNMVKRSRHPLGRIS
jgi:hypothetical protein